MITIESNGENRDSPVPYVILIAILVCFISVSIAYKEGLQKGRTTGYADAFNTCKETIDREAPGFNEWVYAHGGYPIK